MAPIKFEEQLKSKLEKRSLSPSTAGWSKLSERLDADKKKSKLPVFWWLSIAAAMVVMLAVSVQYFNTNNTEEVLPQLVNEEILKEQLKDKQPKINAQKSIKLANEAEITERKKSIELIQISICFYTDKRNTITNSQNLIIKYSKTALEFY